MSAISSCEHSRHRTSSADAPSSIDVQLDSERGCTFRNGWPSRSLMAVLARSDSSTCRISTTQNSIRHRAAQAIIFHSRGYCQRFSRHPLRGSDTLPREVYGS